MAKKVEFIESYIKVDGSDYQWCDNHGELVRCKDCKYFEYNHWEKVNRVPLIVAHEICTKWGEGCKTSEDGYCFLGERKEVEDGR